MSKNYKDKKKNGKPDKFPKDEGKYGPKKDIDTTSHNDWQWYAPDTQIVKDVANLAFGEMLGRPLPIQGNRYITESAKYVPGIMVLNLEPAMGAGSLATDALTVSARLLYNFTRKANSGSSNYEAPDLLCYVLAISSAHAYLAELKRVYGCISHFTYRNKYYGPAMVRAMGYDYEDLSTHLADFRAFINLQAMRLNSLFIPGNSKLLKRWDWLSSNLFIDDNGYKPQTYIPLFKGYYRFSGYTEDTGSALYIYNKPTASPLQGITLDQIIMYWNGLVDSLFNDDDIRTMSGDLLKAFGEGNGQITTVIPENYGIVPVFDMNMLEQISNSVSIMPSIPVATEMVHTNEVVQDANGVLSNNIEYSFESTAGMLDEFSELINNLGGTLLNVAPDDVAPEKVIVATRLKPIMARGILGEDNTVTYRVQSCGSEVVVDYTVYYTPSDKVTFNSAMSEELQNTLRTGYIGNVIAFGWHPIIYDVFFQSTPGSSILRSMITNFDNYTWLEDSDLEPMHAVAVLAEISSVGGAEIAR